MAIDYRRFTNTDWYGYAGAEKFDNGSQPFIAEVYLTGGEAYIVADANGIGVDFYSGEEEVDGPVTFVKESNPKGLPESSLVAEAELRALLKAIESKETIFDLVYSLLHPDDEAFKGFERYN